MPILLNVNVRKKIATGDGQTVVCDNSDYIVNFDFDSEWDEFNVRTMRLVFSNGEYNEVVFQGNQCALPVIQSRNGFSIGVYAGNIHTTVSAWFDCAKSILSDGEQHGEPTPDVYAQILEDIESGMIKGDKGDPGDPGEDGNGIDNIELISTVGRVKTYRINFTDGTSFEYEVTDGAKGDKGNQGNPGETGNGIAGVELIATVDLVKTYRITFTDGTHYDYNVSDGAKGDKGDPGESVTVDDALSTESTNPVQNKVITAALDPLIIRKTATGTPCLFPDGTPANVLDLGAKISIIRAGTGNPSFANPRSFVTFNAGTIQHGTNQLTVGWTPTYPLYGDIDFKSNLISVKYNMARRTGSGTSDVEWGGDYTDSVRGYFELSETAAEGTNTANGLFSDKFISSFNRTAGYCYKNTSGGKTYAYFHISKADFDAGGYSHNKSGLNSYIAANGGITFIFLRKEPYNVSVTVTSGSIDDMAVVYGENTYTGTCISDDEQTTADMAVTVRYQADATLAYEQLAAQIAGNS